MKNAIILSISSDIGSELVKSLISKRYTVYGTFNKSKPSLEISSANLIQIDIKDYDSSRFKDWLASIKWDLFISCIGNLNQ